jgi:hypothetical protein
MSRDGAEQTVVAIVSDLLIEVRIQAAAQRHGLTVKTSPAEEAATLISTGTAALILADLAVAGDNIVEIREAARKTGARVVAYYPHVEAQLRKAAKEAGIEEILPRSRFLRELPAILAARR